MWSEQKKVIYFLILTFVSSYALEFYTIFNGGVDNFGMWLLTSLMWLPALSSFIVRFWSKDWSDIGFRTGPIKAYLLVLIIPLALSFFSFYLCSFWDIRKMGIIDGVPVSKIII